MEQVWLSTPNFKVVYDARDEIDYEMVTVIHKFGKKKVVSFSGPPDDFIFWLFNSRCIMCRRQATVINEIIPRSRDKHALDDFRNRVPLCDACHTGDDGFHHNGVTDGKQNVMRMNREIFLIALGRKEFI